MNKMKELFNWVFRGGGRYDDALYCRAANRYYRNDPANRYYSLGFRPCKKADLIRRKGLIK